MTTPRSTPTRGIARIVLPPPRRVQFFIISWSLAQGLKYYCSNPLNYDPKLHLGCELVPLDLYVRHTARLLNPIFRRAVKYLEPTRHDPVLRRFPNAAEL